MWRERRIDRIVIREVVKMWIRKGGDGRETNGGVNGDQSRVEARFKTKEERLRTKDVIFKRAGERNSNE